MSKHTPGPWRVNYKPNGTVESIEGPEEEENVPGAVGSVVRKNGIGCPACEVGVANARLIAAAPDLLAACKAAIQFMDDKGYGGDTYRILRESIAKAEPTK